MPPRDWLASTVDITCISCRTVFAVEQYDEGDCPTCGLHYRYGECVSISDESAEKVSALIASLRSERDEAVRRLARCLDIAVSLRHLMNAQQLAALAELRSTVAGVKVEQRAKT
jgi:predicted RNA-binding Zn-ribbon protein involved in translation (DUF1610 family)